jgi:divalent metal cation (Fe/Co/Zn/Cd) transporter
VHNVSVLDVDGRVEASLHLKLPGDLPLSDAHEIAEEVERAIVTHVPEITRVQTHLEPLTGEAEVRPADDAVDERAVVLRVVREALGHDPRELRFLHTDGGLVAFLTLGLDPNGPLADAHASASEIEARIRRERPEIADVIVHTEP